MQRERPTRDLTVHHVQAAGFGKRGNYRTQIGILKVDSYGRRGSTRRILPTGVRYSYHAEGQRQTDRARQNACTANEDHGRVPGPDPAPQLRSEIRPPCRSSKTASPAATDRNRRSPARSPMRTSWIFAFGSSMTTNPPPAPCTTVPTSFGRTGGASGTLAC